MSQALLALLLGGFAAVLGGMSSGGSSSDDDDDQAESGDGDTLAPDLPDPEVPDGAPTPPGSTGGGTSPTGWTGLTAEEQLLVELVNRARLDPAAETARLDEPLASGIPSAPVEPLAVTRELSAAAREHSEDMDARNFFAHRNPEGQSPGARAIEEGHGSGFVGENIGVIASSTTSFDRQARVEAIHQGLWESDGHQRNLMDARWSEVGLGYDYGDHVFPSQPSTNFPGATFATEMFGDRGHSYLTGVVIEDGDGDDFYDIGEGLGGVRITATDGRNTFETETWGAGGYSLRLVDGTYRVVFAGGGLDRSVTRDIVIAGANVKVDVVEDAGTVSVVSKLSEPPAEASAILAELPVIPMEDVPLPEDEAAEDDLALV